MLKKILTVVLASAMLLSSMLAFNVSATEEHKFKTGEIKNSELEVYFWPYMHYYYDSNNKSIITKVAAIADFVAQKADVLTPNDEPVYIYNSAKVTYKTGVTVQKSYMSDPFYLEKPQHRGESKMFDDPLILDTAYRTSYIITDHGVSTYLKPAHQNDSPDKVNYPATGESVIYSYKLTWQDGE